MKPFEMVVLINILGIVGMVTMVYYGTIKDWPMVGVGFIISLLPICVVLFVKNEGGVTT